MPSVYMNSKYDYEPILTLLNAKHPCTLVPLCMCDGEDHLSINYLEHQADFSHCALHFLDVLNGDDFQCVHDSKHTFIRSFSEVTSMATHTQHKWFSISQAKKAPVWRDLCSATTVSITAAMSQIR